MQKLPERYQPDKRELIELLVALRAVPHPIDGMRLGVRLELVDLVKPLLTQRTLVVLLIAVHLRV